MQTQSKNKMIGAADNKTEGEVEEYHFSGSGEYEPLTVKARSREEAERIWRETRKKVEPSQIINP